MLLGHLLHESCVLHTGEVMKDFLDFLKDFLLRKTVNLWTEKSVTQPAVPPRAMPVVWFIKNVCNLAKNICYERFFLSDAIKRIVKGTKI